ncbi:MAG: arginine--tRNA ligase [Rhodobacteraceae bacterium]|nr:arginine--tRNA ligase [Paracoccaceae bacterium]
MDILDTLRKKIMSVVETLEKQELISDGLNKDGIAVETPRDNAFGDLSSNVAMVLSKQAKSNPRKLAEYFITHFSEDESIESVEIAGPGFLNFKLSSHCWNAVIISILQKGESFGLQQIGTGKTVNVEFVSANPTGPLHVGHTRGAVFGDVLANLLEVSGYKVTREYYVNDAGSQIDSLARSAYSRYQEALGHDTKSDGHEYPGDYLKQVGEELKNEYGDLLLYADEYLRLDKIKDFTVKKMLKMIREDLADLGVVMNNFVSEKALYANGKVEEAVSKLREMGFIYKGSLEKPKGGNNQDWSVRKQELFKSSQFGDDTDRPIKKADGSWTYFAPDIAYHHGKLERNYDKIINIFGADHSGYISRMKAVVRAFSAGEKDLIIRLCQLVKLYKDGKPVKMSKRAGSYVTLRDLLDEVGKDAIRFLLLMRKNDAPIDFEFTKAVEQTRENPVFYVQYANARICSILKRAKESNVNIDDLALSEADLHLLKNESELQVIKKLAEWPSIIIKATSRFEPHRIAFYLFELAQLFHGLQSLGKIDHGVRFIRADDIRLTKARLAMVRSIQLVIRSGLNIFGIKPVDQML